MNICIMIVIVVSGLQMYFTRVYNFGYSKQLLLLMPVKYDEIPPFYQSLINTWSLFSHKKSDTNLPSRWYTF